MNLSEAIDYLSGDDKYFIRQLGEKKAEALKLVLEVLKDNVDVDEWDYEYEHDVPMCIHCSGNGYAACSHPKAPTKSNQRQRHPCLLGR